MSDEPSVVVTVEPPLAWIRINRPDKLNALNEDVRQRIMAAVDTLADDDRVKVAILHGAGDKAFVAGADVAEFAAREPVEQRRMYELRRVYDAVAEYARRGEKLAQTVAPADARARGYFARLREVAEVLAIIARDELAGRALTDAQRRFLSMVVEMVPGGTGGPPTYTGWYFDIFRGREVEALTGASLVADYYTSGDAGLVAYVGASRPRLGVFVVDVGGAPRVMVGPVANAYELTSSVDRRLDDAAAERAADKQAPWSASHVVSRPPEPRVGVRVNLSQQRAPARGVEVVVQAIAAQKGVRVELLDHHRRVLGGATSAVGIGETSVWVKGPRDVERVEGVRVRVGEATAEGFRAGPSDTVEASLGGPMVSAGP